MPSSPRRKRHIGHGSSGYIWIKTRLSLAYVDPSSCIYNKIVVTAGTLRRVRDIFGFVPPPSFSRLFADDDDDLQARFSAAWKQPVFFLGLLGYFSHSLVTRTGLSSLCACVRVDSVWLLLLFSFIIFFSILPRSPCRERARALSKWMAAARLVTNARRSRSRRLCAPCLDQSPDRCCLP